jgi:plastocyanin
MAAPTSVIRLLRLAPAIALLLIAACGGGSTAQPSPTPARPSSAATAIVATPTVAPAASTATALPGTPQSSPGASTATTPTPAPAAPQTVQVRIIDFAFDPPTVTIPVGSTVVWTNVGPTIHTATSRQGVWDSKILEKNGEFRFTFDKPGDYDYWCSVHPDMLGKVIVR